MLTALSSCKDESEGGVNHSEELFFDKQKIEISADRQTVTLTLMGSTNPWLGELPSKWDRIGLIYYPVTNPDEAPDRWFPYNGGISDIISCSQNKNDDGMPVIRVTISENTTGRTRAFKVDGEYEMYKYNYNHATCLIIQSAEKNDHADR